MSDVIQTSFTKFTTICPLKLKLMHEGSRTFSTDEQLDGIDLHELEQYSDEYRDAEIEHWFELPWDDFLLVGKIDIYRPGVVVELKAVYHIEPIHRRQARFYAAAMCVLEDLPECVYRVRALRSDQTIEEVIQRPEAEQYLQKGIAPYLRRVREILEADKVPTTPSIRECVNCPHLDVCRRDKSFPLRHIEEKTPQEIAEMYVVLRAQLRILEQWLRRYTNVKGPIPVGEDAVGWDLCERTVYDYEPVLIKVLEHIKEHPERAKDFIRINLAKKRQMCNEIPGLENYFHIELKPRFGIIKKERR